MAGNDLPIGPLTEEELRWLRRRKRDEEDARRLLRLLRRASFHLVWAMGAIWGAYEWFIKHITIRVGTGP